MMKKLKGMMQSSVHLQMHMIQIREYVKKKEVNHRRYATIIAEVRKEYSLCSSQNDC